MTKCFEILPNSESRQSHAHSRIASQTRRFSDPDDVPRPVVVYGVTLATGVIELSHHAHRKAQLLLTLRGVFTCEVESGLWLVPPQCAIWIPAARCTPSRRPDRSKAIMSLSIRRWRQALPASLLHAFGLTAAARIAGPGRQLSRIIREVAGIASGHAAAR